MRVNNSIITLTAAVISALILCSCGAKKEEQSEGATKLASNETPLISTVQVQNRQLSHQTDLAGEIIPFEDVALFPKVDGFVESIVVDRGSKVRKGDVLVRIKAPELEAQVAEAEAKVEKARSAVASAQSKLANAKANVNEGKDRAAAADILFKRYKKAAKVPGVIAENEIDQAEKTAQADTEHVEALKGAVQAAASDVEAAKSELRAALESLHATEDIRQYLTVRAPFDGVITERNVHPGSLVKPTSDVPMLKCEELKRLRVVVAVPEVDVAGLHINEIAPFSVPAYPGRLFNGVIARLGHALDRRTRTMPVELDVANTDGLLEPGMYATIHWDVTRKYRTAFVPQSAVGHSLSRTFVDVVRNGKIYVVPVKTGQTMDDFIEIFGDINSGEQVAVRASEDLHSGLEVRTKLADTLKADAGAQSQ
jgi:RND family efflux transporter MFP subunit